MKLPNMGCAASQSAGNSVPAAPDVTRAAPVVEAAAAAAPEFTAVQVGEWGAVVFRQFDTDKDGQLSKKELGRALKSLPRTKPKNVPPGAKFMSVDAMIDAMDADGDGGIDEQEWLVNLTKCAGLAAALAENVGAGGTLANFQAPDPAAQEPAAAGQPAEAVVAAETVAEPEPEG